MTPTKRKIVKEPILRGTKASPGKVMGKIVIVKTPTKPIKPIPGRIIVASFTTPVIALALARAGGIICEKGGLTSHGAIVAREFNIPCVVGVKDALRVLKNNQVITLDADRGYIYEA